MLEFSPGWARVQEKLILESGLMGETTETLLAMKDALSEYREWKSKQKGAV